MAVTFRSEDESFPGTPRDRHSADGTSVREQLRQASPGQTRRRQKVAALLLPTFAVCGPSTNRCAQFLLQELRPQLHCCANLCGQAAMWTRSSEEDSSR